MAIPYKMWFNNVLFINFKGMMKRHLKAYNLLGLVSIYGMKKEFLNLVIYSHFFTLLESTFHLPESGNIPLRKLVYRVLPLPPSMNQYVYDFGTVSGKSEGKYIERIIINQVCFLCLVIIYYN